MRKPVCGVNPRSEDGGDSAPCVASMTLVGQQFHPSSSASLLVGAVFPCQPCTISAAAHFEIVLLRNFQLGLCAGSFES